MNAKRFICGTQMNCCWFFTLIFIISVLDVCIFIVFLSLDRFDRAVRTHLDYKLYVFFFGENSAIIYEQIACNSPIMSKIYFFLQAGKNGINNNNNTDINNLNKTVKF